VGSREDHRCGVATGPKVRAPSPYKVAAVAVLMAAASNNLMKGVYAYSLADRKTGTQSLSLLATLAAFGLLPLLWFWLRADL